MLSSLEMNTIVGKYLTGKDEWVRNEVQVQIPVLPDGINVVYFYNRRKNFVIIPSPLAVADGQGDAIEPAYQSTVDAIAAQIGSKEFGIGCSLLGKGTGERHFTALHRESGKNGKMDIFDSKISAPSQFLSSSNAPNLLEKAWGYFTAPFRTFALWAFGIGKHIEASFLAQEVTIHRLETQPFFDGVSCGLHSTGAVLEVADLICYDFVRTDEIIASVTQKNNLDLRAEEILNNTNPSVPSVSPSLSKLVRKRIRSNQLALDPQEDYFTEAEEKPIVDIREDIPFSHISLPR